MVTPPPARDAAVSWFGTAACAGILFTAIVAAYHNAIALPFVFDDFAAIVENPTLRDWRQVWSPPPNTGVTGRPLVNLTLAIDYALGGLDPRGYHATNVLLHALAALVMFGVIRRTVPRGILEPARGGMATTLALTAAGCWAVHPLLTESVTCVVQRNEIVAGLFFLLTLYCFIRGTESGAPHPRGWHAGALAACWLGMAAKEVMAVAPLLVLFYDRTFVGGTFRTAWRERGRFYFGLVGGWLLLAGLVLGSDRRGGTVGFGLGLSAWDYLLTQCRALAHYLKLSAWPNPLVLDYGNDAVRRAAEVAFPALLLVAALVGTVFALLRRWPVGFAGALFFVWLAPSSSFVPLTTQTIAEHRMYLPLAAVVTTMVGGIFATVGGRARWLYLAAGVGLILLTTARNQDFRSELLIWSDTVAKAPANARAHNNLGLALFHAGRRVEARTHYEEALRLDRGYSPAHANFGDLLLAQGEPLAAIAHYREALRISPDLAQVEFNLGNALVQSGSDAEAIAHYERALALRPGDARKHHALGVARFKAGRVDEAIAEFRAALRLDPDYAEARNNLGTALLSVGRFEEARREFERALVLRPDYARARANLQRVEATMKGTTNER